MRRHYQLHLPSLLVQEEVSERREAAKQLRATLREAISEVRRLAESARDRRWRRAYMREVRTLYRLLELQARAITC